MSTLAIVWSLGIPSQNNAFIYTENKVHGVAKETSSLQIIRHFKILWSWSIWAFLSFSHVWLFEVPWPVVCQAPLSMDFSRQNYWSRLPLPTPGDLPNPRIQPMSLASPTLTGRFFTTAPPGKPRSEILLCTKLSGRFVTIQLAGPTWFSTSAGLSWCLRTYLSSKFSGIVDAAGPETTVLVRAFRY